MANYILKNKCEEGHAIPLTHDLGNEKTCIRFWDQFSKASNNCDSSSNDGNSNGANGGGVAAMQTKTKKQTNAAAVTGKPARYFIKGQGFGGKQVQVIDPCSVDKQSRDHVETMTRECPSKKTIASREIVSL